MRLIVRSNQNAIMSRHTNGTYSVFDVKKATYVTRGTLNACKQAWNKNYANSRQFVTPNGTNHRYLSNS